MSERRKRHSRSSSSSYSSHRQKQVRRADRENHVAGTRDYPGRRRGGNGMTESVPYGVAASSRIVPPSPLPHCGVGGPAGSGPERSVNGWVVFVTGVHEEAQEDDIQDAFADFGRVKSIQINPDRRTGLAKGYAMVEFAEFTEAQDAINALHGKELLGQTIKVDWAFVKPASAAGGGGHLNHHNHLHHHHHNGGGGPMMR